MPKDSDKTPEKPKVLDLIEDKKKPSRRERQRVEASTVKTVDDAKREALDLFAEEKKPKVRKTAQPGKSVLPTISKLRDEETAVEAKVVADAVAAAAPPAPVIEEAIEDPDDPKLVIIKPPILLTELASRLGLKPFQVMADLIKLSVFVNQNQPIDPEIAAKVCEVHGFSFAREKREKGGGVHKVEEVIKEPEV